MNHIIDPGFTGSPRSEMYRSWVYPDIFVNERPAVLANWSDEDLEVYCGIYGKEIV